MKTYVVSLAVGVLVGVIYALLNVRSPAPPVIALLGLLGMLAGEQTVAHLSQWTHPPRAITGQADEPNHADTAERKDHNPRPPEPRGDRPRGG